MLERIDAVRVGTDAPGPQPSLELAPLEEPTLRIATKQIAGVSVGWDHLGAEFVPVGDHLIANGVTQRASQRRHQVKTQATPRFAANAIRTDHPPIAVEQSGGGGQVKDDRDIGIVK